MRAMKEALKKKARQAEDLLAKVKRKPKEMVTDTESDMERMEMKSESEMKSEAKLQDLIGTLKQLEEEFGQLALRQAMKKFEESSGQGMSKKQLNQIILDKNRVISDLEETAYSKGKGLSKPKSMNKWIMHVKEYAKQHGCSYATALKEAKATYKK